MGKSILELKPCPMCKSQSVYTVYLEDREYKYLCGNCGQFFKVNAPSQLHADHIYNDLICGAMVARANIEVIENRLGHLLQSEFIKQFDEIDPETHEYKLPIENADRICMMMGSVSEFVPQIMDNLPQLIAGIMENMPQLITAAAQQATITKCKECRWWRTNGCAIEIVDEQDAPKENDFCSFAERKKNHEQKE